METTVRAAVAMAMLATATAAKAQAPADSTATDSLRLYDLGEVTVVSQKQVVKSEIDKLAYDVQADKEASVKSVLDMLRKVPMVTVDGQDNIKIKGSSSFKIYRNGHRDPSLDQGKLGDVLKAMPASAVKRIEVITDPGAKEDAEGTAYILNIVMMGNASMGGVAATISTTVENKGNSQNIAYLTAQTGKLALSAMYGAVVLTHDGNIQVQGNDYNYNTGQRIVNKSKNNIGPALVHVGNIDMSYEIDSLNLVTLSGGTQVVAQTWFDKWDLITTTSMYDAGGKQLYSYDGKTSINGFDQHSINACLDYQHKTRLDGEALTFGYMLSTTYDKQDLLQQYNSLSGEYPLSYTAYGSYDGTRFTEHTFQIDYIRPIGQHHKAEVGAKYIDRTSKADTRNTYVGDEQRNNASLFNNDTHVAAAYAEWLYDRGPWGARAGLRYEYSRLAESFPDGSGSDFHKNLNDWVPSASLRYAISQANTVKLSLATSISRPGIDYLNPTVSESPTEITYGNINLRSSHETKLTLDFTHIGRRITWNISPYASWTNNQIGEVQFLSGGKQVSTYDGVQHHRDIGLSGYAQVTPVAGTRIMLNAIVKRTEANNHNLGLDICRYGGNASLSVTQVLPWGIIASAYAGGDFGKSIDGVYGTSANYFYHDFSLQRSFLKDQRLTVRLGANNPFGPTVKKHWSHVTQGDYTGADYWGQRQKMFGFKASLRLGKLKTSVKSVDKSIENNDVVGAKKGSLTGGK